MEALAAIGLVSNLLQFVELGCKLLEKAKDIHQSSVGSTEEDASGHRIAASLEASFVRLSTSTTERSHSEQEVAVFTTASECADVARQLSQLLEKTRVKGSRSKVKVFKAAVKSTLKSKEKAGLIARLDHAISALNTQLLLLTRSDLVTYLNTSFEWHSTHRTQLLSINAQIKTLRESLISETPQTVAIVASLRETLDKSHKSLLAVRQHQILESLRFDLMEAREEGITEAHETTYEWILEPEGPYATPIQGVASQRFRSWLKADGGIFFIMGKPGAGKSVLMKLLSRHHTTGHLLRSALSNEPEPIVVKFFFWNAGSDHQKSFNGLVRSLLHSILSQAPELIPTALPKEWAETSTFSGHSWTAHHDHRRINTVFDQLLRSDLMFHNRNFVFFIDGLDELDGNHQHMVKQIRSWSTIGGRNLKICVSSREWNVFTSGFSDCESLQLQMLTRADMLHTAMDTLMHNDDFKRLDVSTETLESFVEILVNKAEGVFLWTSLVLRLLQDGLSDGDELRHLQRKLDVLPTELEDLFEHMLLSIRKEDQAYAFKMISYVSGASSNSPPFMFRMLFLDLLYETDGTTDPAQVLALACKDLTRPEVEDYLRKQLKMVRKRLIGRCKCLIEIREADNIDGNYTVSQGTSDENSESKMIELESTPFFNETVHLAHRKVKEYIEGDKTMSVLNKFANGINWQADTLRTLTEHINFQINYGHMFIGWPRLEDSTMRMHPKCMNPTTCATECYARSLTQELMRCYIFSQYGGTSLLTPADVSLFLEHVFNLFGQGNRRVKWLKSECSNGAVYSYCGKFHLDDVNNYAPVLTCAKGGTHVSIPHLCAIIGATGFFEKRFMETWSDSTRIYDRPGMIRCLLTSDFVGGGGSLDTERSARLAKIFDLLKRHGPRVDQVSWGCCCDGFFEVGYEWTIWQAMFCCRLLGRSGHISPEDWNALLVKLLDDGIDIQLCLEVHFTIAKEHLRGYPPGTQPTWTSESEEEQYLLAEIWTRPVKTIHQLCTDNWTEAARPDHGPISIFLLRKDTRLAKMAKEKGGMLYFSDLLGYMGIQLDPNRMNNTSVPSIPPLLGWKINPKKRIEAYDDLVESSPGRLVREGHFFTGAHRDENISDSDRWIKVT
ncbi:hypothetical protein PGQ11_010584 [Apiospora arundinis]|uniref:NACHT domain-containing protein n=1 Tax=Apiospora arundinis TaxID=335852 RepID=A0ABR2IB11_9PEZI